MGTYTVTLTAGLGGCVSSVSKTIEIVPDSTQLQSDPMLFSEITAFTASPNPTRGAVRVTVDVSAPRGVRLRVYDSNGRPVDAAERPPAERHEVDFELGGEQPGVYYISLTAGGERRTLSIILQ